MLEQERNYKNPSYFPFSELVDGDLFFLHKTHFSGKKRKSPLFEKVGSHDYQDEAGSTYKIEGDTIHRVLVRLKN